jgi:2-phospho-L-lactate guanylyltransferase
MSCWIVIPIKELAACKTRLRSALDDGEREGLVRTMLHHVMSVIGGAAGNNRLLLLAPPGHDMPPKFERIPDKGRGLNGELCGFLKTASGVDRIVIVPADLPLITEADLKALIDLSHGHAAIAPDRARIGTNALSLPLPVTRNFQFQFGHDSFERHRTEAARLSLPLTKLYSDGLAFDIDEPSDLIDFRERAYEHRPRDRHLETGGVVGSK